MAASTAGEPLGFWAQCESDGWTLNVVPLMCLLMAIFYSRLRLLPKTWALILPVLVAVASLAWASAVSRVVPEPYLDEVFHVPQAQKYCEGKFREWDDKITTPPGLYLLSNLIPQALRKAGYDWDTSCSTGSLRAVNLIGLFTLAYLFLLCRHRIEALGHEKLFPFNKPVSEYSLHSACNVALFPLLFFFSGLYYTDVISTAVVLGAFLNHLCRVQTESPSFSSDLLTILLGLFALLMRQTNIFWVVVYMGGLEAVHAVKKVKSGRAEEPLPTTTWQRAKHFVSKSSWGEIHDLSLSMSWPDDAILTVFSLAIAAICNPFRILKQIWPYFTILGAFAAFIAWNGGVVLGDKSNHIATIHLAQMLYIWPFLTFFSLPLVLPCALYVVVSIKSAVAGDTLVTKGVNPRKPKINITQSPGAGASSSLDSKIRLLFQCGFLLAALTIPFLIVRYNTIIHPFTLADNRHYMFYVFRYTIRRGPLVRYFLIAPYALCGWMVYRTLGGCQPACASEYNGKSVAATGKAPEGGSKDIAPVKAQMADPLIYSINSTSTSTGLMLLIATSLSLITAPLVEPRYFIIPWVMWRLQVPAWRPDSRVARRDASGHRSVADGIWRHLERHDARLALETLWFLAINLATCFIFLTKPYVWKAEDGRVLDDGRLQRFMW
ncbi:hypothetical protein HIM_00671 [Hirsutella minnesotensis 3608]|nr:hypothetical protein HIM_00671 [Hirsutella minnesotensis 3608]